MTLLHRMLVVRAEDPRAVATHYLEGVLVVVVGPRRGGARARLPQVNDALAPGTYRLTSWVLVHRVYKLDTQGCSLAPG